MSDSKPSDSQLRQLKIASIISYNRQRQQLLSAFLCLSQKRRRSISPTIVHWSIPEVDETEFDDTHFEIRMQARNPLFSAAVKRLVPFLSRKCVTEFHRWRLLSEKKSAFASSIHRGKDRNLKHYFRVLNLIGRRRLEVLWTAWKQNVLYEEIEEIEESVVTVNRRVVMEKITYFHEGKTDENEQVSHLEGLKKALSSVKLREKLDLLKVFTRFKGLKTLRIPTKPKDKTSILRRLFLSAKQREKLDIANTLFSLKSAIPPKKHIDPIYLKSSRAMANMISDLLATRVYNPFLSVFKGRKTPEINSPLSPPLAQSSNSSPTKATLRAVHFGKKLKRLFKTKVKWAFKRLMDLHPTYQKRRFYRIQKGMKAMYNASILSVQSDVFELLRYLLYMKTRDSAKILRVPLFAYPLQDVVTAQRLIRGFLARRLVRKYRIHKQESPEEMLSRYSQSIKFVLNIQRLVRGFLQRRLVKKMRQARQEASTGRPSLKGTVLSSRVIMLTKAIQKTVTKAKAGAISRLFLRSRRAQIRRCIRIQKGTKQLQRSIQLVAFARVKGKS